MSFAQLAGGGLSASSSAGAVDGRGGSLSSGGFNFGGIQTGGSNVPGWILPAVAVIAVIGIIIYVKRK